jgi:hypothetical protein
LESTMQNSWEVATIDDQLLKSCEVNQLVIEPKHQQSPPWRDNRRHLKLSAASAFITDSSVLRNGIAGSAIKTSFRDNTARSAVASLRQSERLWNLIHRNNILRDNRLRNFRLRNNRVRNIIAEFAIATKLRNVNQNFGARLRNIRDGIVTTSNSVTLMSTNSPPRTSGG